MQKWIQKNKAMVALSYLILFGCILAGLAVWDHLPDEIPTHFDISGQPDGFSGRLGAVVGMPCLLIAAHTFLLFMTAKDPKNGGQPAKMNLILVLIIPLLGVVITSITLAYGLGHAVDVSAVILRMLGILFLFIGNYLPKVEQNYTVGIRVPWTLADEGNWRATHRVGGWCFAIAGLTVLLATFFLQGKGLAAVMIVAFALAGVVPVVYSFLYFSRHGSSSSAS